MNQQDLQELVDKQIAAIKGIPIDSPIIDAVELIHQQVHEAHGKVIISGMGKAGHIGYALATTLSSTGTTAVFLHPGEAQHGDLGVIQDNDVLFLISNSGKTREILELVTLTNSLYPAVKIIGMSGHPDGPLHDSTDIMINTGNPEEICPIGLTPTTSTLVMSVVNNLIVVALMKKINFTKSDYAKRHHSGYLGQIAKENG